MINLLSGIIFGLIVGVFLGAFILKRFNLIDNNYTISDFKAKNGSAIKVIQEDNKEDKQHKEKKGIFKRIFKQHKKNKS